MEQNLRKSVSLACLICRALVSEGECDLHPRQSWKRISWICLRHTALGLVDSIKTLQDLGSRVPPQCSVLVCVFQQAAQGRLACPRDAGMV